MFYLTNLRKSTYVKNANFSHFKNVKDKDSKERR